MASHSPSDSDDAASGDGTPVMVNQGRVPGMRMKPQEERNWCWASVTQAILRLQGGNPNQQDIATEHAQRTGKAYTCAPPRRSETSDGFCLPAGCTARCGDVHALDIVLEGYGLLDGPLSMGTPPSFAQIQQEIAKPQPVPCHVQWLSGGGHFVLISGWGLDALGVEWVFVLDPADDDGSQTVSERSLQYHDFISGYRHPGLLGTINDSYRVG